MKKRAIPIELYYWPGIQGRGEFVRLLLEDAEAAYVDVARERKNGLAAMMRFLAGEEPGAMPFAPPFVKVGTVVVSQTANIFSFLAPRLGLVPDDTALRAEASQIRMRRRLGPDTRDGRARHLTEPTHRSGRTGAT